jgi:hypothetical protein
MVRTTSRPAVNEIGAVKKLGPDPGGAPTGYPHLIMIAERLSIKLGRTPDPSDGYTKQGKKLVR